MTTLTFLYLINIVHLYSGHILLKTAFVKTDNSKINSISFFFNCWHHNNWVKHSKLMSSWRTIEVCMSYNLPFTSRPPLPKILNGNSTYFAIFLGLDMLHIIFYRKILNVLLNYSSASFQRSSVH